MTWQPWQLSILAIINLFAGFCFGYLYRKFSSHVNVCEHEWGLYTDKNKSGNPFVRQCDYCKKTEYYEF